MEQTEDLLSMEFFCLHIKLCDCKQHRLFPLSNRLNFQSVFDVSPPNINQIIKTDQLNQQSKSANKQANQFACFLITPPPTEILMNVE